MRSIMQANEMNRWHSLDKPMQYGFLFDTVGKIGYQPWEKKIVNEELKAIQWFYQVSKQKALEIISLLTKEEITDIMDRMKNNNVGRMND